MKSYPTILCLFFLLSVSSCSEEDTLTGSASITLKTRVFQNTEGAEIDLHLFFKEEDSSPFKSWEKVNLSGGNDITLDAGKLNYGNYYIRYWTRTSTGLNSDRMQPFQVIAGEHKSVTISL